VIAAVHLQHCFEHLAPQQFGDFASMLLIERGKRKAMSIAFLPALRKEFLGLLLTQEWTS